MSAELVRLDDRRTQPRPRSARFLATVGGDVALEVVLASGEVIDVTLTPEQAARLILQGTDAVEMAEGIRRG